MRLDKYQKRCILVDISQGWSSLGGRASVLSFFWCVPDKGCFEIGEEGKKF